ncbi:hypothetical protein C8R43DRAFT_1124784 [Mycena crocata]|nr:hypothetical protein C8R43DRAFT_1124784 [Mycena crocata]
MVKAAEFGEDDEEYSGDESESDSGSSDDFDSDYEEFRRKKKLCTKKKKEKHKKKLTVKKKEPVASERQKFQGNKDEIAGMIWRLNAMRLDDPEYAPVYYRVMTMDQSGTAKQCMKAPVLGRTDMGRPPGVHNGPALSNTQGSVNGPATYPNNTPIGQRDRFRGCYGCMKEGHHISQCPEIGALVERGVIMQNPETRKLVMKDGTNIWKRPGESLAAAAERAVSLNSAPRVMLGIIDLDPDQRDAIHNFYQEEARRAQIMEVRDPPFPPPKFSAADDKH